MEFVDPQKPETWRNEPAPPLEEWMVNELLTIGETNQYGQPNLRFAWGQERLQFRINKERLLYVDTRIPAIEHKRYTFKKTLFVEKIREHVGTNAETGEMIFEEREVPHVDVITLDHPPGPGDIIPAGYLFDEEYPELEWIGEQFWYVEQYIPPEHILGGADEWERLRFDIGTNPDTGKEEMLDWLGPFPSGGRYQTVHFVGKPCQYIAQVKEPVVIQRGWKLQRRQLPDGSVGIVKEPELFATGEYMERAVVRDHFVYVEPDNNTFDAIRKAWFDRNNKTLDPVATREAARFYDYRRFMDKQAKAQKEENRKAVRDIVATRLGMDCGNRSFVRNTDAMANPLQVNLNRHDRRRQQTLEKRGRKAA